MKCYFTVILLFCSFFHTANACMATLSADPLVVQVQTVEADSPAVISSPETASASATASNTVNNNAAAAPNTASVQNTVQSSPTGGSASVQAIIQNNATADAAAAASAATGDVLGMLPLLPTILDPLRIDEVNARNFNLAPVAAVAVTTASTTSAATKQQFTTLPSTTIATTKSTPTTSTSATEKSTARKSVSSVSTIGIRKVSTSAVTRSATFVPQRAETQSAKHNIVRDDGYQNIGQLNSSNNSLFITHFGQSHQRTPKITNPFTLFEVGCTSCRHQFPIIAKARAENQLTPELAWVSPEQSRMLHTNFPLFGKRKWNCCHFQRQNQKCEREQTHGLHQPCVQFARPLDSVAVSD